MPFSHLWCTLPTHARVQVRPPLATPSSPTSSTKADDYLDCSDCLDLVDCLCSTPMLDVDELFLFVCFITRVRSTMAPTPPSRIPFLPQQLTAEQKQPKTRMDPRAECWAPASCGFGCDTVQKAWSLPRMRNWLTETGEKSASHARRRALDRSLSQRRGINRIGVKVRRALVRA